MAPASAPPPPLARLPPPAFALLYTRAKVYVHPTPYARDNVPGVLALLRDGAAPLPAHSLWLSFIPEASLPSRDDTFVHVPRSPGAPAAEQFDLELESDGDAAAWREAVLAAFLAFYTTATRTEDASVFLCRPFLSASPIPSSGYASAAAGVTPATSDRLALTPPLSPEQYAFAFPLAAAHGLVLTAPTFSQWYGSVRMLFKSDQEPQCASVPLLTLFYHDDESVRALEQPPHYDSDPHNGADHTSGLRTLGGSGGRRRARACTNSAATTAKGISSPSSSSRSSSNLSRTSTPVIQRISSVASSPAHKLPAPTWGGDELVTVLRRYTNVLRSLLQPGLILLNPSPETLAQHGSPYFEANAIDRTTRHPCFRGRVSDTGMPADGADSGEVPFDSALSGYDSGLDDIYRLNPYFLWQSTRSLVLTRFATLTQSARQASQQVLALSGASAGSADTSPSTRTAISLPKPAAAEDGAVMPASAGASPRSSRLCCLSEHDHAPHSAAASTKDPVASPAGLSTPVLRVSTPGSTGSDTERGRVSRPIEVPKSVRARVRDYLHVGLSPLSKPVQTFAQAGPVPMGPLTDAEWGRISQQGGIEFDSARTYLSQWARLVADAGERCRRTEESVGPPATSTVGNNAPLSTAGSIPSVPGTDDPPAGADEAEEEVGQLGVFELLARCPDVPSLPSTRAQSTDVGPISVDEWNGWFEQRSGRLSRPVRAIKQAIFARGLAPDAEETFDGARRAIWPFLLGVVEWDSTRGEREEAYKIKRDEYQRFKRFWECDPALLAREDVLDQRSLIRKDCLRTDRNHPLFRTSPRAKTSGVTETASKVLSASIIQEKEWSHAGSSGNLHVARLGEILLTYGFWEGHQAAVAAAHEAGETTPRLDSKTFAYQPPTGARRQKSLGGYVQGMSDLCALLYIVCNGDEVVTFWCFAHLMQRLAPNFFIDQYAITGQLLRLQRLLALMDPAFYAHLEQADGLSLFFAYRWFLVGFRREFSVPDTLKLWDCMLAAEFTPLPRLRGSSIRSDDVTASSNSPSSTEREAESEAEQAPSRWRLWSRLAQVTGVEAESVSQHRSTSRPATPPKHPAGCPGHIPNNSVASASRVGLTSGFSLFVALAMMQAQRDVIMHELFEFDDILAFINGLSNKLNVDRIIAAAEKAARAAKVLFHMRDAAEGKPVLPSHSTVSPPETTEGVAAAVSIPRSSSKRSSAPQVFSSGSCSCSCSAFVQVTCSSSGSGWSRVGGAEEHPASTCAENDPTPTLAPMPPGDLNDGKRDREHEQETCLHRVWEVNEEDFVVGLDDFSSPVDPPPLESPCLPASTPLDEADMEEIHAAQALARSKGAMSLCARIDEAEDLRELVL